MTIGGVETEGKPRRLRLGMVGGGRGAFIGAVHRIAARLDDRYELVAGALASEPERAKASAYDLRIAPERAYGSFAEMARAEAAREDRIDVVAVVTPNNVHHAAAKVFLQAGIHVICDKPLTTSLEQARDLVDTVAASGALFALTHNYSGYPMVRQMREMIRSGELGEVRLIQMQYAQAWLATRTEKTGNKQAEWRTDPARSGPAGCLGDIGTHAYHLASFVTGWEADELAADLSTFMNGRTLDDNAQVLLRYPNGARGMLWASQVAPGHENGLSLRIYGTEGGIEWAQEHPNQVRWAALGRAPVTLSRGGPGLTPAAAHATRIPAGHPEGYLEGFAQLYTDFADQIAARLEGRGPDPTSLLVPTVEDGFAGVAFIAAALRSSENNAAWVRPERV